MSKTDTVVAFSLIFARKVHYSENSYAFASASVLHSAAVAGSVVGVVRPL